MRENLDFHGDCKMYSGQQNFQTLIGMDCLSPSETGSPALLT